MKAGADIIGKGTKFMKDNAPAIATGCAIVGTWLTAICAARNTVTAMQRIEEAEEKKGSKLDTEEKIQTCLPVYVPTLVMGGLTTASQITAFKSGHQQTLAAAGLAAVAQETMSSYAKEVVNSVGETKELEIRHNVGQKKIEETMSRYDPGVPFDIIADKEYYTIDCMTGNVYLSNSNRIEHARLEVEKKIYGSFDHEATIADFFYALGDPEHLDPNVPIAQYPNGWNADHPLKLSVTCGGWKGLPCYYVSYQAYNLQTKTPITSEFLPT